MEYISGYASGLIVIVIFSSFIELLLPKGDIKKYVSFASGLIIVLMAVGPLFNIKGLELPNAEVIAERGYKPSDISEIYTERLEKKVEQNLGITDVKITVNPENLGEILYVSTKQKKKEISELLGVPMNRVGD